MRTRAFLKRRLRYKADLRFFTELRQTARRDAMETVDYSVYEEQIRKLVDKQVIGTEVREPEGVCRSTNWAKLKSPKPGPRKRPATRRT